MKKRKIWLAGWLALLLWFHGGPTVQAQQDPDGVRWQAAYWTNTTLAGEPVLTQTEIGLNYNWGDTAPSAVLPSDRYSARWTTTVNLVAGEYRFTIGADDGMRLWVNDQLVVDAWTVQSTETRNVQLRLPGGEIPLRVDYFENTGVARIFLTWQRVDLPAPPTAGPTPEAGVGGVWRAEYFDTVDLQGNPDFVRTDAQINFDWGTGAPVPGFIDRDRFAVRWQSTQALPAARYRFTATVDDGARLWVDNNLLIDQWRVQSVQRYYADFTWTGGPLPVRMEYYEDSGNAVARLTWVQISTPPALDPPDAVGAPLNFWIGEYYNNVNLAGEPALMRNDATLDFNWRSASPAAAIVRNDRFSARWTRTLSLLPGPYQFTVTVDDGLRLWVAGQLVIDEWELHDGQTFQVNVNVVGGATPVRMEYFENSDQALARLNWTRIDESSNLSLPAGPRATVTGTRNLNVRTGPGVTFARRTVLAGGEEVALLARSRAGVWVQIQTLNDTVGWVNSRYLTAGFSLNELPVAP